MVLGWLLSLGRVVRNAVMQRDDECCRDGADRPKVTFQSVLVDAVARADSRTLRAMCHGVLFWDHDQCTWTGLNRDMDNMAMIVRLDAAVALVLPLHVCTDLVLGEAQCDPTNGVRVLATDRYREDLWHPSVYNPFDFSYGCHDLFDVMSFTGLNTCTNHVHIAEPYSTDIHQHSVILEMDNRVRIFVSLDELEREIEDVCTDGGVGFTRHVLVHSPTCVRKMSVYRMRSETLDIKKLDLNPMVQWVSVARMLYGWKDPEGYHTTCGVCHEIIDAKDEMCLVPESLVMDCGHVHCWDCLHHPPYSAAECPTCQHPSHMSVLL